MVDCFANVPIISHDLKDQSLTWLRMRYGQSPQVTLDASRWRVALVWEQSAAMTCGVRLLDEHGDFIPGFPVVIGWPGVAIGTKTNGEGWVDVPINGGNYSPLASKGPMFIEAEDGSWKYTGIGWLNATNHDHLCLNIQRANGTVPPPPPPPPGNPYAGMSKADVLALRALLVTSRDTADQGVRLIDRVLEGIP